jgi:hypothetical protein
MVEDNPNEAEINLAMVGGKIKESFDSSSATRVPSVEKSFVMNKRGGQLKRPPQMPKKLDIQNS